jgi:hypothetical protein
MVVVAERYKKLAYVVLTSGVVCVGLSILLFALDGGSFGLSRGLSEV